MFTFSRRIQVRSLEALEHAQAIAEHAQKVTGVDVVLHARVGGPMNTIAWTSRFDTLDELTAASDKLLADQGYQKLVREALDSGGFVEASGEDAIHRQLYPAG